MDFPDGSDAKIPHSQHSSNSSSVTQSCPTFCNPMEYSTLGLSVHHQLPEFTEYKKDLHDADNHDAVKVLHSICQQILKTQQWPQDWKKSVFIPIPKKDNAKECQTMAQLHSSHTLAMAPHSSTLAWKIPWTEGPGGLHSMGLLGVRHD